MLTANELIIKPNISNADEGRDNAIFMICHSTTINAKGMSINQACELRFSFIANRQNANSAHSNKPGML